MVPMDHSGINGTLSSSGSMGTQNGANGIAFNSQQSFVQSNIAKAGSSHMQGQQFSNIFDQQSRQLDPRNFQLNQQQLQQLSAPQNQTNFNSTNPRPQQTQPSSEKSLLLPPQQQQMLQMSRSSPQAPINLLHQQRRIQFQQQQQQNSLRAQNSPSRPPLKTDYEPGMGALRLMRYMYEQRNRPQDNNIEFWRKFVAEFFTPNAKKKWCVSMYGSGRQTTGVLPQDVWQCEICNCKPGKGFEATTEVLPRLFKIKYESGTLEELLYVDMPKEYQNSAGQIILDYSKAIQQSVFDQLRVIRDGQLRIVLSPELKICSWEFCARSHEEYISRRSLIPQVNQLGAMAQRYQGSTQARNILTNSSSSELQNNSNAFVASAKQLSKALEVPLVNDLGYAKRFVRCLQISEVVNSMKDLIDYSGETGSGPMECLAKFGRRSNSQSVAEERQRSQPQRPPQQHQTMVQNSTVNPFSQVNPVPMSMNRSSLATLPATSSANPIHTPPLYSTNGPQNHSPNISMQQAQSQSGDDSQNPVQKIINQMRTHTQSGLGNFGSNVPDGTANAINNTTMMSPQGLGGPLMSRVGSVNGYKNRQFDWKPSP